MTYGDKWEHLRDLQVVEDKLDFFKIVFYGHLRNLLFESIQINKKVTILELWWWDSVLVIWK